MVERHITKTQTGVIQAKRLAKDRLIHRTLGVAFVALLVGAVWLTYAVFSQKFTDFDKVTLKASSVGLQMPEKADIKIRGVLVGQVLSFSANRQGATMTLGFNKGVLGTDLIPANVTGEILPKTLFGEKYVNLVAPTDSSGRLQAGATIAQTTMSTEVSEVLADLYPLLTTVQPGDLNVTLSAIATALEGRGAKLGSTITTLDGYLKKLNPQLPAAMSDIDKLATVSDTYAAALPQVANILRNTITTTTTLREHLGEYHALLGNVAAFAGTAQKFLQVNGDNIIQLGQVSAPAVSLVARYSVEFPCMIQGANKVTDMENDVWRGEVLHVILKTLPRQPRLYDAGDRPHYGDTHGPSCFQLPTPHDMPYPSKINYNDGVNRPTGIGTDRAPLLSSYAGTSAEKAALDALLAPTYGGSTASVPGIATLMLEPMARGSEVNVQ